MMSKKVLITFASKHGATAEIAGQIGAVLSEAGLIVDVRPATEVRGVLDYEAVVVGSAVYLGQWRKEAIDFLKMYAVEMRVRPVWIFSSGPTGAGEPSEILEGWHFPDGLQATLEKIQPHDIALFHGSLVPERLSFLEQLIIKGVNAPTGDYRNWDDINGWAATIAAALTSVPATP